MRCRLQDLRHCLSRSAAFASVSLIRYNSRAAIAPINVLSQRIVKDICCGDGCIQ